MELAGDDGMTDPVGCGGYGGRIEEDVGWRLVASQESLLSICRREGRGFLCRWLALAVVSGEALTLACQRTCSVV